MAFAIVGVLADGNADVALLNQLELIQELPLVVGAEELVLDDEEQAIGRVEIEDHHVGVPATAVLLALGCRCGEVVLTKGRGVPKEYLCTRMGLRKDRSPDWRGKSTSFRRPNIGTPPTKIKHLAVVGKPRVLVT